MNAENFKEFIENPSRLYQLSYQELKSLALQYPYSANLHYLLLQKSAMENHRELSPNRQRAAAYSIDRTHLYQLIRKLAAADAKEPVLQLDLEEEFLELKDLSLLEMTPPTPEETERAAQDTVDASFAEPDLHLSPFPANGIAGEDELEILLDNLAANIPGNDEQEETPIPPPPSPPEENTEPAPSEATFSTPETPPEPIPAQPREETPYRPPESLLASAASVAGLLSRLSFPAAPQAAEALIAASPVETPAPTPPAKDPSRQRQAVLLHKLDNLIAERSASSPVAVPPPGSKPTPQPKRNFTSWVQQFQSSHVKQQLGELMETKKREELKKLHKDQKKHKKKKNKHRKERRIIKFAEQSLTEHQSIISETLAELLAGQGEIGKSIKMYEKLKLVFPEKSAYFAAIIEKLKKE